MRITAGLGRFVFIAQWFLGAVLLVWVVIGRALLGVQLGWLALFGVVAGLPILIGLLLPPLLTLFDPPVRRAGTARYAYSIASIVIWAALFVMGPSMPDAGDNGSFPSFLSLVFGLSEDASSMIWGSAVLLFLAAWVVAIGLAVAGIVVGRRAAAVTAGPPAGMTPPG